MAIARRRAWVIFLGVSLLALTATWAPPPAQAATCQNVPGSTPGLDVSVGGQPRRIPAVSNISVCVDTGAVPLVAVTFDGRGYCTWSCVSVIVPGGSSTLPALTLSYRLDGVLQTHAIGGGTAPGGSEACLLSVGGPDAPYPTCYPGVALGVDQDPTSGVLEAVQDQVEGLEATVQNAVANATATLWAQVDWASDTVNGLGEDLGQDVEDLQEDAGALLNGTVLPLVDSAEQIVCDTIPPIYYQDGWEWREVRFCDDPVTWATHAPDAPCNYLPAYYDPNTYEYVSPCNNVVAWVPLFAEDVVNNGLCAGRICAEPKDVLGPICTVLRDWQIGECQIT